MVNRVRTVITPSGGIVRGKFPSKKNNRLIHHEGLLELEACYLFELSPYVTSYREQPIKIQYSDGIRLRTYTPDFELTLSTGDTVLVEIKHSAILARAEVQEKYNQITYHMLREDQPFSILTETSIRQEPRLSNLRLAYRELLPHAPTNARLESVLPHLAILKELTIGDVSSILQPHNISAFDLLARGYLSCDLTLSLNSSTPVSISTERDYDSIRLSEELSF
ncbi:hypothetical protein CCAE64S_01316 [Castellaniella caeni]